jgi:hypothetical protein
MSAIGNNAIKRSKNASFMLFYSVRPEFVSRFCLPVKISAQQIVLFNYQVADDRITEKRKLAPSLRVLFGGALHLTRREFDADGREFLPGGFKTEITRLLHRDSPYSL